MTPNNNNEKLTSDSYKELKPITAQCAHCKNKQGWFVGVLGLHLCNDCWNIWKRKWIIGGSITAVTALIITMFI